MYFDFEGRNFGTPTVESAISWREQILVSVFAHVVVVLIVLFAPSLEFFRAMEERRAERLAELAQERAALEKEGADQLAMVQPSDDTFVFIAPRLDREAEEAPRDDAPASDKDRIAQSPERTFDPDNQLPIAEGNSSRFVESDIPDEPADPLAPLELEEESDDGEQGDELGEDESSERRLADASTGDGESAAVVDEPSDDPGTRPDDASGRAPIAESLLKNPGEGPGDPDDPDQRPDIVADGLLGRTSRTLNRAFRRDSFHNLDGDTGRFGPELQFDSKGVEFGPWVRRFKAQVYRNWFVPYRVITDHGNVALTFTVHRDGALTGVHVVKRSLPSFNRSAANALNMSNPTVKLPDEYPEDELVITATFYFNELPPVQQP